MSHEQRLKENRARVARKDGKGGPAYTMRHVGGGWFELTGGVRVRGKAKAAAELARMAGE